MNFSNYFMSIAETVSLKSKDPKTKVGCVIVDSYNRIVSTGYNGMPVDFPETKEMWQTDEKHKYVIHAEVNAVSYCNQWGDRNDSEKSLSAYTTLFPCLSCAKALVAKGVSEIYFLDRKFKESETDTLDFLLKCEVSVFEVHENFCLVVNDLNRFSSDVKKQNKLKISNDQDKPGSFLAIFFKKINIFDKN